MPRPHDESLALVDARRRKEQSQHVRAAAIQRAVRDVLEDGAACEVAARNRGVPEGRVKALVRAARAASP